MFSLREYREPTHRLPDKLPWAFLIGRGLVIQKEAIVQKTIAFRGPDLSSSSDNELISAVAQLNNALKRLGSGWAIFVEAQRFASDRYPSAVWDHPAAWLVDHERRRQFRSDSTHFESSYYLTFVHRLPAESAKWFESLFFADPERADPNVDTERDLQGFLRVVDELTDLMRGVFAEVGELDDDQTLTYLHSTISTNRHPVRAAQPGDHLYLDALLPDMAFTPGDTPMLGSHFIPTATINGFPGSMVPGILDDLNHLPLEYRWVARFIGFDKEPAKAELSKFRKRWMSKRKGLLALLKEEATKQETVLVDNAATNKAADADAALQELGDDLVAYGLLTITITVWDADWKRASDKMLAVKQVIQSHGFAVRDEHLNSEDAWLGSLPGHVWGNVRRPLLNTVNVVHTMPISAVWAGEPDNSHLRDVTGASYAHVYCKTVGHTPFRLNLNVGDLGHTLVLGPAGAGKSVLLSVLGAQWLKYPGARVVVFDKDRSSRATTLAVRGQCYEPGNAAAQLAFQPLARIDDPSDRIWAAEFIGDLFATQGIDPDPHLQAGVDKALAILAQKPAAERTLTIFAEHLGSPDLSEALRPYTLDGNYGQIFDADHDDLRTPAFWRMFEMGSLMALGEAAVVPALNFLFHRIEADFDGRPTLVLLDEAWLFLKHPTFQRRLQAWLKTLRKKNVYVVFATQEVADAVSSPIMPTILTNCATQILLPDPDALSEGMKGYYRQLNLSDAELAILSAAQKKRDYYYRSAKGRRLFQLDLDAVALAFAGASSPADQAAMDEIVRTLPPEKHASALLRRRNLHQAAQLLDEKSAAGGRLRS